MSLSPNQRTAVDNFVAQSAAMVMVLRFVELHAGARSPIVIAGATGTGKTTLAGLIHALSGRQGPFRAHTAGEFDPGIERSQVFGHERGAFTGAASRLAGIFEDASEGTLLLDDFHHLRLSTQILVLRALDQWAFRPLGGNRELPIRCRLIIGLEESPDVLVERSILLKELRYRLGYGVVQLPLLADRRDDIPSLAQSFLDRCPHVTGVAGPSRLEDQLLTILTCADWPGNVRQLEMVIREGYLRAAGSQALRVDHLAELVSLPWRFERRGDPRANARAIELALSVTDGNAMRAAKLLQTTRSTVYRYATPARGGIQRARSHPSSPSREASISRDSRTLVILPTRKSSNATASASSAPS